MNRDQGWERLRRIKEGQDEQWYLFLEVPGVLQSIRTIQRRYGFPRDANDFVRWLDMQTPQRLETFESDWQRLAAKYQVPERWHRRLVQTRPAISPVPVWKSPILRLIE